MLVEIFVAWSACLHLESLGKPVLRALKWVFLPIYHLIVWLHRVKNHTNCQIIGIEVIQVWLTQLYVNLIWLNRKVLLAGVAAILVSDAHRRFCIVFKSHPAFAQRTWAIFHRGLKTFNEAIIRTVFRRVTICLVNFSQRGGLNWAEHAYCTNVVLGH